MKTFKAGFLIFVIVLLTLTLAAQDKSIEVESKITQVKLFPDGAEICRTANLKLVEGRNQFALVELSPHLDQNSIQLNFLDNTGVSIISYEKKTVIIEEEAITPKIKKFITLQTNY